MRMAKSGTVSVGSDDLAVERWSGGELKDDGVRISDDERLVAAGTMVTYFTSVQDDGPCMDLTSSAATTGAPGDWYGLVFHPTSGASSLENCQIQYGGRIGSPAIDCNAADITVTDCLVRANLA